jgi:AAA+ superfamily predicted ATPase
MPADTTTPTVPELPSLAAGNVARVRALLRNLAWQVGPEALVGAHGADDDKLPGPQEAAWLATVRTLHGAEVARAAIDHRQKALTEAQAAIPAEAESRLDLACELLGTSDLGRRLLEVVTVTVLDPATAHAARVLAQRLSRQGATDPALIDDVLAAAGHGAGAARTLCGAGGQMTVAGAIAVDNGQLVPSRPLLSFLEPVRGLQSPLEAFVQPLQVPTSVLDALSEVRAGWLDTLDRALRTGRILLLSGTHGFGGLALLTLAARKAGLGARAVSLHAVFDPDHGLVTDLMPMLHAEARLTPVVWALARAERAQKSWREDPLAAGRLVDALWRMQRPIALLHEGPVAPEVAAGLALAGGVVHVEVPPLKPAERETLIAACLAGADVPQAAASALASEVRHHALGVDQVAAAVAFALQKAQGRAAKMLAEGTPIDRATPTADELRNGCSAAATSRLRMYGSRVDTTQTWQDLVLEPDALDAVKNLARFAASRDKLFMEWGFERLMPFGRALSAMFSGPSGTGKTMVAGLIAKDLGVELYRVDLSRVVSKYIGETEERLGALFSEATQVGAALLFDECDSLFGQRTEIKSSHDRYANLEVNYLLQRLEEFDGVVILTTNFASSIDEAFLRRIRFRVQFPFPTQKERARLWEVMLPPELPQDDEGLDLDWMGQTFELSGGHVRNAVLRAAMLAAHHDKALTMRMLYDAAAAEYKELGKLAPHYAFDD